MTLDEFAKRAIRVPFVIGGRDWSGWDCWGLVVVAYQEVAGVKIESFARQYNDDLGYQEIAVMIGRERPVWNPIPAPQPLAVSLYRINGREAHTSLCLDARTMLHAVDRVGTYIEPIDGPLWEKRHVGFFERGD